MAQSGPNPDRFRAFSQADAARMRLVLQLVINTATAMASVAALRSSLAAATRLGAPVEELLASARLNRSELAEAHRRVPLEQLGRLDAAIRAHLGEGSALLTGELIGCRPESIVGQLCHSAPSLRAFFECVGRYSALIMDTTRPRLEIRGRMAWFGCEYTEQELQALGLAAEKEVAAWLAGARSVTLDNWTPEAVHLQTPATDIQQYRRFFGAPVQNEATGCWLVFDSALLDTPVLGADRNLFDLLSSQAQTLLAGQHNRADFADRVRQSMLALLREGPCRIDEVAAALAVSPRTLQRRLEREGTTFGAVFDETRQTAALECLRNPAFGIKETAFRVGFSEPSTFYRAFRRWTGVTPAHFRRSIAS